MESVGQGVFHFCCTRGKESANTGSMDPTHGIHEQNLLNLAANYGGEHNRKIIKVMNLETDTKKGNF